MTVLDADSKLLAAVTGAGPNDADAGGHDTAPDTEMTSALSLAQSSGRLARHHNTWVAPVVAGPEALGSLVLQPAGDSELSEVDQRILERASVVIALLLLFQQTMTEAEERVRGELLDDLLAGRVADVAGVQRRAERIGMDLSKPHVVLVARHDTTRQRSAFWLAAAARDGLMIPHGKDTVFLLPGDSPGDATRRLSREVAASLGTPVTVGGAGPLSDPRDVADAHAEARRCLEALLALGRDGEGAGVDELGAVGLLLADRADVGWFLDRAIGPVVAYDQDRGSALIETLEVYFACRSNLTQTAERLHIHVNTVSQRLDRVGKLLGDDWRDPDRAMDIQLALRLHRLR